MEVENVSINQLRHAEYNPRKIKSDDFDQIKKSIEEFGFVQPLVVNFAPERRGVIIGGNQRFEVAKKIGMTEVPVYYVDIPDLAREKELNIRLNKNQADWDFDILKTQFDFLSLKEWGFEKIELRGIFETSIVGESDSVPAAPEHPKSCPGEIYVLGNHRFMCGDATNPQHVDAVLNGSVPHLMVTDPPYGVNYDPEWRDGADLGIGERSRGKVDNDDRVDWTDAYSLFPGDVVYLWHAGRFASVVSKNLEDCGFQIISQIIWAKQHFALSRGDYHWQHEPCWYAVKKGKNHHWGGARDQATVWEIKNNNSFGNQDKEETFGHGTQKPLECMGRPIENNSEAGDVVYDPFLGSGTTLIAGQKLNRKCYGLEVNPKYCDVIIKRYCQLTGANEDEIFRNAIRLDGSGKK